LTVLALTGAFVLLTFSAAPSLFRAAGLGPRRPQGVIELPRGSEMPEHPGPLPGFGPLEDDEPPDEDSPGQTDGLGPRDFMRPPEDHPRGDKPEADPPSARMRPAIVRRSIKLYVEPSEESVETGAVQKGDSVYVIKESGDWVLVLRSGREAVAMGWTKRAELAIR
jgi:hypothetical protein